ncbi:hypothetical protein PFISCL1PPCAC_2024 [Pristionchus fissidentatus]|uniref:Uncharacterized protein n=1 Tax=Pristionchus fissidentatus TaxID=1538716 RepID=A0AAV5UVV2_9BILA|nr:hypothetical protein PFISCL1PPCAC_2024 [Pristionchus fissidentatus]
MENSWPGGSAHRRSISTVTAPNEVSRFYMNNFPGRPPPPPFPPYSNQPHYGGETTPHQQSRYFRDDSSTMGQNGFGNGSNDATPPMFDPRRFSPPQLDTPPANQESRSFSFDSWNGESGSGGMGGGPQIASSGPLTDPIINNKHDSFQQQQCNSFSSPCTEIGQGIAQMSFPNYDPKSRSMRPTQFAPPPQQQQSVLNPYHRMGDLSGESMGANGPPPMQASTVKMEERRDSHEPQINCGLPHHSSSSSIGWEGAEKRRSTSVCVRKLSEMAMKSQLRSARFSTVVAPSSLTPYTPPPILSPRRSGTGLYCQITNESTKENPSVVPTQKISICSPLYSHRDSSSGDHLVVKMEEEEGGGGIPTTSNGEGRAMRERPQRKNGLFYSANDEMDLEALRKDSWASTSSAKSGPGASVGGADRKLSWYGTPSASQTEAMRKASSVSDCYYDCLASTPQQNDPNPHINIGRDYQARVKKWADREILVEERESIPDRDEMVYDCKMREHLTDEQMHSYENLANSVAVPRFGRNRELALHLLMENKGNLEAAVMDLLRSDTLDWEQYPIIHNYLYNDSNRWSPDQINAFQDAMYKTEKDFHLIAQEIGMPVKVCVEWYYTWKKVLPDDYRKLRNLRRKRRLLEAQMGVEQQELILMGKPVHKSSKIIEEDDGLDESSSIGPLSNLSCVSDAMVGLGPSSFFPAFQLGLLQEGRSRMGSFSGGLSSESPVHKNSGNMYPQSISPSIGDLTGAMKMPNASRPTSKKGAQPAADGMFHCRLCDKSFEKVKSLNAHMKSHAMKARAEAEARGGQVPSGMSQGVMTPSLLASTLGGPTPLNEAQLQQQLGIVLGLNGMQHLANGHPLAGLHLAPSLGIH